MTIVELKSAIGFGKDMIEEYKERCEDVPSFIYERIIDLQEELFNKTLEMYKELSEQLPVRNNEEETK